MSLFLFLVQRDQFIVRRINRGYYETVRLCVKSLPVW